MNFNNHDFYFVIDWARLTYSNKAAFDIFKGTLDRSTYTQFAMALKENTPLASLFVRPDYKKIALFVDNKYYFVLPADILYPIVRNYVKLFIGSVPDSAGAYNQIVASLLDSKVPRWNLLELGFKYIVFDNGIVDFHHKQLITSTREKALYPTKRFYLSYLPLQNAPRITAFLRNIADNNTQLLFFLQSWLYAAIFKNVFVNMKLTISSNCQESALEFAMFCETLSFYTSYHDSLQERPFKSKVVSSDIPSHLPFLHKQESLVVLYYSAPNPTSISISRTINLYVKSTESSVTDEPFSPEELSGFLNELFDINPEQVLSTLLCDSIVSMQDSFADDSLYKWLQNSVTTGDGSFIGHTKTAESASHNPKGVLLYPAYVSWCAEKGLSPLSLTKFGSNIMEHLSALGYKYARKYRRNLGVFIEGITLKDTVFSIDSLKSNNIPFVMTKKELPAASQKEQGILLEGMPVIPSNTNNNSSEEGENTRALPVSSSNIPFVVTKKELPAVSQKEQGILLKDMPVIPSKNNSSEEGEITRALPMSSSEQPVEGAISMQMESPVIPSNTNNNSSEEGENTRALPVSSSEQPVEGAISMQMESTDSLIGKNLKNNELPVPMDLLDYYSKKIIYTNIQQEYLGLLEVAHSNQNVIRDQFNIACKNTPLTALQISDVVLQDTELPPLFSKLSSNTSKVVLSFYSTLKNRGLFPKKYGFKDNTDVLIPLGYHYNFSLVQKTVFFIMLDHIIQKSVKNGTLYIHKLEKSFLHAVRGLFPTFINIDNKEAFFSEVPEPFVVAALKSAFIYGNNPNKLRLFLKKELGSQLSLTQKELQGLAAQDYIQTVSSIMEKTSLFSEVCEVSKYVQQTYKHTSFIQSPSGLKIPLSSENIFVNFFTIIESMQFCFKAQPLILALKQNPSRQLLAHYNDLVFLFLSNDQDDINSFKKDIFSSCLTVSQELKLKDTLVPFGLNFPINKNAP
nr:putative phage/plasmid DNA primase [Oedogonium sp. 260_circle1_72169]